MGAFCVHFVFCVGGIVRPFFIIKGEKHEQNPLPDPGCHYRSAVCRADPYAEPAAARNDHLGHPDAHFRGHERSGLLHPRSHPRPEPWLPGVQPDLCGHAASGLPGGHPGNLFGGSGYVEDPECENREAAPAGTGDARRYQCLPGGLGADGLYWRRLRHQCSVCGPG